MDIEAEIRRVAKLLEIEIHVAGSSKRAVEKKLGVGAGYLTKVVKGGLELRLRHILAVAEVTGFDVAEFFHKAFPRKPAKAETLAPVSSDELMRRIDRSLEDLLRAVQAELAAFREAPASGPPAEEEAAAKRPPADHERSSPPPVARHRPRGAGRRS